MSSVLSDTDMCCPEEDLTDLIYRRFHAWQSLMLGAGLAVLHLLLLWSRFFTWVLILVDIGMYGNLA